MKRLNFKLEQEEYERFKEICKKEKRNLTEQLKYWISVSMLVIIILSCSKTNNMGNESERGTCACGEKTSHLHNLPDSFYFTKDPSRIFYADSLISINRTSLDKLPDGFSIDLTGGKNAPPESGANQMIPNPFY